MPNLDPWLGPDASVATNRPAAPVGVYRGPGGATSLADLELLDNVACEWVHQAEGADPGTAAFRYRFTDRDPSAPQSIEAALATDSWLPKVVLPGDRLVVVAERPDGVAEYLFDGEAYDFGFTLSAATEGVDFFAQGIAFRLWDQVVDGAYLRDADDPINGNGYQTGVVARCNPKGKPNCVPLGGERTVGNFKYPVFVDANAASGSQTGPRKWLLPDVAKYLAYHHNSDEQHVKNPSAEAFDAVLVGREPIDGVPFDPADESTYTKADLVVQDKPLTGHGWPHLLHKLVGDKGFAMCFRLQDGGDGPMTGLDIYVQQDGPVKDLWLAPRGTPLDPRYFNIASAAVRRETRHVVNEWTVEGALVQYEASFILWPLFPMTSADGASLSSLRAYDRSNPKFLTSNRNAYRLYGVDELGYGHYKPGTSAKVSDDADFSRLFGTKDYSVRRRPPKGGDLITTDPDSKQPLRHRLEFATDYTGKPGLWDGTSGTWKPVSRGFLLRKDQLGIWLDVDNPNHWTIGEDPESGAPIVLKGVEDQAKAQSGVNFCLRLTCVIEGDDTVRGFAAARPNSAVSRAIGRRIDARDRVFKRIVAAGSLNNTNAEPVVARDDTDSAKAEAIANRTATECGILDGQFVVPYLTTYYGLGDRIRKINGRELGFRTDGAGPADAPVYPRVVGRRLILGDAAQHTVLEISDEQTRYHALERKARR